MPSESLRLREKWQDYSGRNAVAAEKAFLESFSVAFRDTQYAIRSKPKEFRNIYKEVRLSKQDLDEIYVPDSAISRHGVSPDYAIDNTISKKTLYVEVKRQDGWVEGGKRSDGRGNAHERSCKYFAPGLLKVLREQSKIESPALPFWTVFQGDITRDPCRVREISLWYQGFDAHFFFWRQAPDPKRLLEHFESELAELLD